LGGAASFAFERVRVFPYLFEANQSSFGRQLRDIVRKSQDLTDTAAVNALYLKRILTNEYFKLILSKAEAEEVFLFICSVTLRILQVLLSIFPSPVWRAHPLYSAVPYAYSTDFSVICFVFR
jgi:hypothetical protein